MKATDDYNDTLTTNTLDDNIITLSSKCTNIKNNIDINIPTIVLTKQSGLSFLCLISLMVYTLIKPLKNIK